MVKKLQKKDVNKRVEKCTKRMPFQPSPRTIQPRSMKDRQQMWCLAGLRYLKAPIVVWCEIVISFDMYAYVANGFFNLYMEVSVILLIFHFAWLLRYAEKRHP